MRLRLPLVIALCGVWCIAAVGSVLAQQFDGARYVDRTEHGNGDYTVIHFEVKGNSVVKTFQFRYKSTLRTNPPENYQLTGNFFTYPLPTATCLELYSTTDCGIRGTLSEREIRFTTVINGRHTGQLARQGMQVAKRQH